MDTFLNRKKLRNGTATRSISRDNLDAPDAPSSAISPSLSQGRAGAAQEVRPLPHQMPDDPDIEDESTIDDIDSWTQKFAESDLPTNMSYLQLFVAKWTYDWGPESTWPKMWNEKLRMLRITGESMDFNMWFGQCETHVDQGREILRLFKYVASGDGSYGHSELESSITHGYDLVCKVMAEVQFFQIKLDEYAPVINVSRECSSARHYIDIEY